MPFSPNIYKPLSGVSKKIFSLSRIRNYRTYNKKLSGEKWIFILRTLAALVKLGIFFFKYHYATSYWAEEATLPTAWSFGNLSCWARLHIFCST